MLFSKDAFADKVALITGAGRGIGKAIAKALANLSASVVIGDINWQGAQAVAQEIESSGGKALPACVDVTKQSDVEKVVSMTLSEFGTVHILVNNVGIYPRHHFDSMTFDEFDNVIRVNLHSAFLCSKVCAPIMQKQRWGRIINIASVRFWVPDHGLLHYVASKGAMVGLTRALAHELGEYGITVNAVAPGGVALEEELSSQIDEERRKAIEEIVMAQRIKRRLRPEDVANLVVFLASEEAWAITGQTILIDGGWVLR